jgi:DNA-binding NarL/FixJ family response regulator
LLWAKQEILPGAAKFFQAKFAVVRRAHANRFPLSPVKKRVLVVDDHPLFRAGVVAVLRSHPDWDVCAEASDAAAARAAAALHRPDAATVDLMLQDDDGLKLLRELRQEVPGMIIVVLSMLDPEVYRPKVLQAGASAFVPKVEGPAAILAALGSAVPPPSRPEAHELSTLTERELQVFQQFGQGRSTQEIAIALGVSVKTIETHRENIKAKLNLPHANAVIARAALWRREQRLDG